MVWGVCVCVTASFWHIFGPVLYQYARRDPKYLERFRNEHRGFLFPSDINSIQFDTIAVGNPSPDVHHA